MNIVNMHKEIDSINDVVQSPRFHSWQKDQAINYAIRNLIKNRYEKAKQDSDPNRRNSTMMRLRDEFFTIVKKKSSTDAQNPLAISNDIVTLASLGSDYLYLLAIEFEVNNLQKDYAKYLDFSELPVVENDPYRRPTKVYPYRYYYVPSSAGIELLYGKNSADAVTYALAYYLSIPLTVSYGTTVTPSTSPFGSDKNAIAQADGTIHNSITYNEGDEFTLTQATMVSAGSASIDFINSDLPEIIHDEIVKDAASFLELKVKDYQKWKALEEKEILDQR